MQRGRLQREAKNQLWVSRAAGLGPSGGTSGEGLLPSQFSHNAPGASADKNGLCSLEERDRNRQETCLFLRAVRGNSCSVKCRLIREKQPRPGAYFPLQFFFFLLFCFSSLPIKGKRKPGTHPTGQGWMEACCLKKAVRMNLEIPTLKSQWWLHLRHEFVGDF